MISNRLIQLEVISKSNNATCSIPLDISGNFLLPLGQDIVKQSHYAEEGNKVVEMVWKTAVQAFAISLASEDLYRQFKRTHPNIGEAPDVSQFEFTPALRRLYSYSSGKTYAMDTSEKLAVIDQLLIYSKQLALGKSLYSPYFEDPHDTQSQLDASSIISYVYNTLYNEMHRLKNDGTSLYLNLTNNITNAIITNSVTRAHLLPLSIPVNTQQRDLDSGYCDLFSNTSFRRGDRVVILAKYGDYCLLHNNSSYGWVKASDIGILSQKKQGVLENEYTELFYIGSYPLFYGDDEPGILLPGDSIFAHLGKYYVMVSDKEDGVSFRHLPDIKSDAFVHSFSTPQDLVNFLYQLRLPYIYSIFDCSEVIRRSFIMLGYSIRKYSGDMTQDFNNVGVGYFDITTADQLDALEPGLYVSSLLSLATNDEFISRHIYIVAKKKAQTSVFSYAFNVLNENGTIDYPIGPHECKEQALKHQISRKRKLRFFKIAEEKQ